jgi:type I restriction enzyme M protein
MRVLVHYHAYGDAKQAEDLVTYHGKRLVGVVERDEAEEIARITAEFQSDADKLAELEKQIADLEAELGKVTKKPDRDKLEKAKARIEKAGAKLLEVIARRDEQIAEVSNRANEECDAIQIVGKELVAMYGDTTELVKHARVVDFAEVEENECNLNIPRYVDTFAREEPIDVNAALAGITAEGGLCALTAFLMLRRSGNARLSAMSRL